MTTNCTTAPEEFVDLVLKALKPFHINDRILIQIFRYEAAEYFTHKEPGL